MIAPSDVVKAATNLQSHSTSNVANVSQRAAIAALEADLEAARAEARELRAIAEREDDVTFREQLARLQGFVGPSETRVVVLNEP